jgi:DNA polymerase III sliding clamp (beta) subunit (PCNA family)
MYGIARRPRLAEIEGRHLTAFDVAPDGKRFRLNFTDDQGRPAAITLPTECLNDLLMTLPRIVSRALHARYRDSSLRVVFPAEEWRLEGSDDHRLILTIGTSGGFEASFLVEREHLRDIVDSLQDEAAAGAPAPPMAN